MASHIKIGPMTDTHNNTNLEQAREVLHRQILSTVSHDLKTPLATMIGSLEIFTRMHDKLSPEKRASLIQAALSEAYRLDQFITNILDMAKLEGGLVSVKWEAIDLRSLIDDCITRLGPRAKLHTIHVNQAGATAHIVSDQIMLGRAVGLVLDNAIKHAGKKATIDVRYGGEGKVFFVSVSDNGLGIAPGREADIFSKYTRIARSDQQNAGTGLGLAICRQMMAIIGGSVIAENIEKGGAKFTLRCPA